MVVQAKFYTIHDLWEISHQAGDIKRYELIKGELRQMSPTGGLHGLLALELGRLLGNHVVAQKLGYVTAAETGFILAETPLTVRAPDVGFVAKAHMPQPIPQKYIPVAPDLAVEVVSPSDTAQDIREKVIDFLQAGTRIVWVVYPESETVDVYRPGKDVQIISVDGILDGGDVVPGLHIPLRDVFKALQSD
jgi:Uma2 family endonuclease